jgi:hypothetical protein
MLDEVLGVAARVASSVLREEDTVGRFGPAWTRHPDVPRAKAVLQ